MNDTLDTLAQQIVDCKLCAEKFAKTQTSHTPRPVVRPSATARILIAGQAPGARVHASGVPFDDPSGDRLRDWMCIDSDTFYDTSKISIIPMAFCFPGYDERGSDLPPPPICAKTWRADLLAAMSQVELTLLVGQYAQRWHMGKARKSSLTETVRNWQEYGPAFLPLPHPSWRNSAWLRRNPWFAETVLPWLKQEVARLV